MKKSYLFIFLLFLLFFLYNFNSGVFAQADFTQKFSGRILLQVQSHGEAWYINPTDLKRYYLGRPADAFNLMRNFGQGITDQNLTKLPVGIATSTGIDTDNDGLTDELEKAIGTDPNKIDTDDDGFNDKIELANNYSPAGNDRLYIDSKFAKKYAGRIFLAIQSRGEAWYINPTDLKRYFLGRPTDAFNLMRDFSLGITDIDLNKIIIGDKPIEPPPLPPPPADKNCNASSTAGEVISTIADAIRKNQNSRALSCFTANIHKAITYTLNFLSAEGRLILGNIISGSTLAQTTSDTVTYDNEVYFSLGGYKVPLHFYVKKQPDGRWLLTNL